MNKKIKCYIRFYSPGSFTANTEDQSCDSLLPLAEMVAWPERAYAFTLHQREDIINDEKTYRGEDEQIDPIYYHPDSQVTTLEETKNHRNATEILISNMEMNGWDAVVWTRWGNWPQPFDSTKHKVIGGKNEV